VNVAAGGAFGSPRLTDDQTVDTLERARRRRKARLSQHDDGDDVLGRLAEFTEGIESAFNWTGSSVSAGAKQLADRRESAEVELLEMQVEQSRENLDAARAQNELDEERMALENRDTARRSFIGLILGLLRIARSTVLFILLTWIAVHILGLFGEPALHLPLSQIILDRVESYLDL
jgi:hypothetical protein